MKDQGNKKKNRERWLGDGLEKKLLRIKEAVKKIYANPLDRPLKFFTPHGQAHCQSVEKLIHLLIPNDLFLQLREKERFYLLASAWLHDLGMTHYVSEIVSGRKMEDAEVRKMHHLNSKDFVVNHYHECGLDEADRYFMGELCKFHRSMEDINRCAETMIVGGEKYRLQLLAAYLRLADSLHIDFSRTPNQAFTICLASDIPESSKIHWLKSRLISGIHIDHVAHAITLQYQVPSLDQLEAKKANIEWIRHKIDNIIQYIMDNLREELASVINILTRAGISVYLDIKKTENQNLDGQMLDELLSIVINYDIMAAPSATKLMEIILMTYAGLGGIHLKKGEAAAFPESGKQIGLREFQKKTSEFLQDLEMEILSKRPCHSGLKKLIEQLKKITKKKDQDFKAIAKSIDVLFQNHHLHREAVREKSRLFYHDFLMKEKRHEPCNILLFGYSELVIKAICGFRDGLIGFKEPRLLQTSANAKDLYNSPKEWGYSKMFRLFICDGQPKSQTAPQDRLLYHDGYSYASALAFRNFTNIVIIPDIVVGSILENFPIHFVMVGANGFTDHDFKHSAGHGSIIHLIHGYAQGGKRAHPIPQTILVTSTDKWSPEKAVKKSLPAEPDAGISQREDFAMIEGYNFWRTPEKINAREHIWITQDKNIQNELHKKKKNICFFNPREDTVPIKALDFIICNVGFFPIRNSRSGKTEKNISRFIQACKNAPALEIETDG